MLVDVTPLGVNGKEAEHLLDEIGITVNRNSIPFDKLALTVGSGIRVGTPATTSRGFREPEMRAIGETIVAAIVGRDAPSEQARLAAVVHDMCSRFPVPGLRED
jgi:glycine hydroxymethyltransferase